MKAYLLAIFLFVLGGCSQLKVEPPEVHLLDLQLQGATLLSTRFLADLELRNVSRKPIRVDGARYTLIVNGVNLGTATSDTDFTVPALSNASQKLEFSLSHLSIAGNIQKLTTAEALSYQVDGRLFLSPWGELPIRSEGRVSLGN